VEGSGDKSSPASAESLWVADSLLLIRVKAIACCTARDRDITPKRSEVSRSARTVQGNATGLARDEVTTEERSAACSS
jgi:hypothetical protein